MVLYINLIFKGDTKSGSITDSTQVKEPQNQPTNQPTNQNRLPCPNRLNRELLSLATTDLLQA